MHPGRSPIHGLMTDFSNTSQKLTDRIFLLAFILLTVGSVVPVWIIRILPQQDVWQHLALVDVIFNYWSPGSLYPDYFILPDAPKPNLFYYYFTSFIGNFTPSLEFANKIVLSLYVLAFPASFLYFLRSFKRSKWLAFFSFPFIYNAMFYLGFVSFTIALPMLFVGLGAYRKFLNAPGYQQSIKFGVLTALLMVFMYFTHAHVFLLACMLCGVMWLMYIENGWDAAWKLWPAGPSLAFFIPWFQVYFIENTPSSSGMNFGSFDNFFGPRYYSSSQLLSNFFNYITNYFRRESDDTVFLLVLLLLMILLIMRRAPEVPVESKRKLKFFDLEILTIALAASVVILPHHIQAQSVVSLRHILPAFLFFIGWAGFEDAPKRISYPTILLVSIISVISIVTVSTGFMRFDRELDGYSELFKNTGGSKRLLKVVSNQDSRVVYAGALWHIHHLYSVLKGGISNIGFAEYPHNPIQYKPGMVPPKMGKDFTTNAAWRYYDYILVRKDESFDMSSVIDAVDVVAENRGWTLYKTIIGPAARPDDIDPIAKPRRKSSNVPSGQHLNDVGYNKPAGEIENANDKKPVSPIGILSDDIVRERLRHNSDMRRQRPDARPADVGYDQP